MSTPATPRTAEEAEAMGWTVDRHTYPWCAYIGPRFDPERCVVIATPASGRSSTDDSVQQ